MGYRFVRYRGGMLPLRQMPSADGRALRALYRERLARGLVVCADANRAEYPIDPDFPPEWGCLSIVAVNNGREEYRFPSQGRTLVVDDDVYLLLDPSSRYSYRLRSLGAARCLMVSFPPWMVAAASRAISNDLERDGAAASFDGHAPPRLVTEQLMAHDDVITPELRRIERACVDGVADAEWHRQQMAVLLTRLFEARATARARFERLSALRPSTRRELARRVAIATDCIHEGYRRPLDLETLASAAGLSPFHLLRVFKSLHGMTPQAFLQRKRVAVAGRLMKASRWSASHIAKRVGFRSRSSFYRWRRRVAAEVKSRSNEIV